jgi:hypothetical protein
MSTKSIVLVATRELDLDAFNLFYCISKFQGNSSSNKPVQSVTGQSYTYAVHLYSMGDQPLGRQATLKGIICYKGQSIDTLYHNQQSIEHYNKNSQNLLY